MADSLPQPHGHVGGVLGQGVRLQGVGVGVAVLLGQGLVRDGGHLGLGRGRSELALGHLLSNVLVVGQRRGQGRAGLRQNLSGRGKIFSGFVKNIKRINEQYLEG